MATSVACGMSVPWPGIEPMPPPLDVQSLNHWASREVPLKLTFKMGLDLNIFLYFHMKLFFWNLLKKAEFIITSFTSQKSWVCAFEKLAACFVRTPSSVSFCHFFLHLIFHYFSCTVILTFFLFPVGRIGPLSGRELCWASERVPC